VLRLEVTAELIFSVRWMPCPMGLGRRHLCGRFRRSVFV